MKPLRGLHDQARLFAADRHGGVAVTLALALPVLLGFAMLVIDGSRYYNLNTSLQGVADAASLAAAAELDRKPDAIDRAELALQTLVQNSQRMGEAAGQITRSQMSVRYLKSLPPKDGDPITSVHETTDPEAAHFVEVAIRPVPFRSMFLGAFAAASSSDSVTGPTQASAKAVAGFDSVACNVTPLFICNPFEGTSVSLFVGANEPSFKRRLIALKEKGSSYGPGNYGYLEAAAGSGASEAKQAMAAARPAGCYSLKGVSTKTGTVSSTADAMNVRFGMYDGLYKNDADKPEYRPARNVRKRPVGASCSNPNLTPYDATKDGPRYSGFPRDACHENGNCRDVYPQGEGRVGDGVWDFAKYWQLNYGGTPPSDLDNPSRYEVYRYEVENDYHKRPSNMPAPFNKDGQPQCYKGDHEDLSDTPDRRVFTGAILNCKALASDLNGHAAALPVVAYGRFFLTEPVDKNDGTIWAELVEVLEPGTPSGKQVIRDTVQLYR